MSARLLLIGALNAADDEGNFERSAKQIKAKIFPSDHINCEPLIKELLAHGLLIEYSVDGKNYLHIKGFKKHQVINRASQPRCPLFMESLITHAPLIEDSRQEVEGKGREGKLKPLSADADDYPPGFQRFWKAWPNTKRKGGRPSAFKVWVSRKCEGKADAILAHVESMKLTEGWRSGYEPKPKTYLNAEDWDGADLSAPASGEKPWFMNGWQSIVTKGREFNLEETDYPTPPEFRSAVLLAAGVTPAMLKQAEADWK